MVKVEIDELLQNVEDEIEEKGNKADVEKCSEGRGETRCFELSFVEDVARSRSDVCSECARESDEAEGGGAVDDECDAEAYGNESGKDTCSL